MSVVDPGARTSKGNVPEIAGGGREVRFPRTQCHSRRACSALQHVSRSLAFRQNSVRTQIALMKYAIIIVRILLGLMFAVFGSNAFIHFMPIPEMHGLPADFMGALIKSGYILSDRDAAGDRRITFASRRKIRRAGPHTPRTGDRKHRALPHFPRAQRSTDGDRRRDPGAHSLSGFIATNSRRSSSLRHRYGFLRRSATANGCNSELSLIRRRLQDRFP